MDYKRKDGNSRQEHGPQKNRRGNGRLERGVFRNGKLDGIGTVEFGGMSCHGRFDQGQLVEILNAKLSSGAQITWLDDQKKDAKRPHSLVIDDFMVKELKLMNQTDQTKAAYEWGVTCFVNSDVLREMYKDGVRHGISFLEENDRQGIQFSIYKEGSLRESYKLDKDGNVEVQRVPHLDIPGVVRPKTEFAVFRGKLERLFQPRGPEFWAQFRLTDGNVLEFDRFRYEGQISQGVPEGFGKLTDPDGKTFEGSWKEGAPQGKGKYTSGVMQVIYSGLWERGLRSGFGSMRFEDGTSYSGQWKLDVAWGEGKYINEERDEYEGLLFLAPLGPFLHKESPKEPDDTDLPVICSKQQLYGLLRRKPQKMQPLFPPKSPQLETKETKEATQVTVSKQTELLKGLPYDLDNKFTYEFSGEVVEGQRKGFGRITTFDRQVFEGEFGEGERLFIENMAILGEEVPILGSFFCRLIQEEPGEQDCVFKEHWIVDRDGKLRGEMPDLGLFEVEIRGERLYGPWRIDFGTGEVREGQFVEDHLLGQGKWTMQDGAVFTGEFVFDRLVVKNQPIAFEDGSRYQGDCLFQKTENEQEGLADKDRLQYQKHWFFDCFHGHGEHRLANGSVLTGGFKEGLPEGLGEHRMADGSVLKGNFKKGLLHGQGSLRLPDGEEFSGEWFKGMLKVKDQLVKLEDGSYYQGECLMRRLHEDLDLPEGLSQRRLYKNQFAFALRHGRGVHYKPGEFLYAGEFGRGQYHGQGKRWRANGEVYEGLFRTGQENGFGKMAFANGDQYSGEFRSGEMFGQGVFTTASGLKSGGFFRSNKIQVNGHKDLSVDGTEFEGPCLMVRLTLEEEELARQGKLPNCHRNSWKFFCQIDFGTKRYPDGLVYEGWLLGDMWDGRGRVQYPDGSVFQGEFRRDLFHGFGKYIRPDGTFVEGVFVEGRLTKGAARLRGGDNTVYVGSYDNGSFKGVEFTEGEKCLQMPPQVFSRLKDCLSDELKEQLVLAVQDFTKKTGKVPRGLVMKTVFQGLMTEPAEEENQSGTTGPDRKLEMVQTVLAGGWRSGDEEREWRTQWSSKNEGLLLMDRQYKKDLGTPNPQFGDAAKFDLVAAQEFPNKFVASLEATQAEKESNGKESNMMARYQYRILQNQPSRKLASSREIVSVPKEPTNYSDSPQGQETPIADPKPTQVNQMSRVDASQQLLGEPKLLPGVPVSDKECETYEGDRFDGHWHGQGKLKLSDGTTYEGQFERGLYHGLGVLNFDGDWEYRGRFIDGLPLGQGELRQQNAKVFIGYFMPLGHKRGYFAVRETTDNLIEIDLPYFKRVKGPH